jgi:hypothetical protein
MLIKRRGRTGVSEKYKLLNEMRGERRRWRVEVEIIEAAMSCDAAFVATRSCATKTGAGIKFLPSLGCYQTLNILKNHFNDFSTICLES